MRADYSEITKEPFSNSHEENGLIERANQEVISHLTAMIAGENVGKKFPAYLPFIQKGNSRTSVSQLIVGNTINH